MAWAVTLALAAPAAAQWQSMEITPAVDSATIGDPVPIDIRIRLLEQDALLDSVPALADSTVGVRLLRVEPLRKLPEQTINSRITRTYEARAWVAFYRVGTREVPAFSIAWRRGATVLRGTLGSNTAKIEIVPTLPPGNPPLKDLKPIVPTAGPNPLPLVFIALAAGVAIWLLRRRRRAVDMREPEPAAPAPPAPEPEPFERAMLRLEEIAGERWPHRGETDRHYEEIVAALRDYLERAESVPAGERTTAELLWSLPPHLTADGLRDRCHALLREADLVKFARVEPGPAAAEQFLDRARALLERWHAARSRAAVTRATEVAGAVR